MPTEALGATVVLDGETLTEAQRGPKRSPPSAIWSGCIRMTIRISSPGRAPSRWKCSKMCRTSTLVIPIGGGGLIAGNAIAARARKPSIEIVGVECALYPSMWNAVHNGNLPCGGATLAEGIAVKNVGTLTLPLVRELVSDIILVEEPLLERAVNAFVTLQKAMAEGAGAAGLAAMMAKPEAFAGRKVGLILCGGNIDPRILASVMVRELERADRIVSFRLTIPDRPGILGQIAGRLGELGANILGVDHHRLFLDVPAKGAKLDVTMETRDGTHAEEFFARSQTTAIAPCGSKAARLWSEYRSNWRAGA